MNLPDSATFERLAREAMAEIPAPFSSYLSDIVLVVEEVADPATLRALSIRDPMRLAGLYRGRPIGEKSSFDVTSYPDEIHLYRRPLLAEWMATGETLGAIIRHVVVHEVGHHFGLSDADMHALEDSAGDDD
ncbi:metallopeptidase family protein [Stakelama sediminis]|nr:metallopeptidase family protein [Stakelama sediminis]